MTADIAYSFLLPTEIMYFCESHVTSQLEHNAGHGFSKLALKISQQVALSSEQKKSNIKSKCMQ